MCHAHGHIVVIRTGPRQRVGTLFDSLYPQRGHRLSNASTRVTRARNNSHDVCGLAARNDILNSSEERNGPIECRHSIGL